MGVGLAVEAAFLKVPVSHQQKINKSIAITILITMAAFCELSTVAGNRRRCHASSGWVRATQRLQPSGAVAATVAFRS